MHDEDYAFHAVRDGDYAPYDMHGRDLRGNFLCFGENSLIAFILILMVQSELHISIFCTNLLMCFNDQMTICLFAGFGVSKFRLTFFLIFQVIGTYSRIIILTKSVI